MEYVNKNIALKGNSPIQCFAKFNFKWNESYLVRRVFYTIWFLHIEHIVRKFYKFIAC